MCGKILNVSEGSQLAQRRAAVNASKLEAEITELAAAGAAADRETARAAFVRLREHLSAGTVRAAEPDPSSAIGWRVKTWVKQGLLPGFRFGGIVESS